MDVVELAARFWSLGGQLIDLDQATLVRHPTATTVPLGTFLSSVRADSPDRLTEVLARAERLSLGACRRVLIDAGTPPAAEAYLALHDWQLETQIQLVLPATVTPPDPDQPMLPVTGNRDRWDCMETLFRIDHVEEDTRAGRPPRSPADTAAAVRLRRALGPTVRYFVAERRNAVVGCIAVWVSERRSAMIEDVFVHPDARGAGIATQMLRFAVSHARGLGAGAVQIGADPTDTPKNLYSKFGFQPVAVTRAYSAVP